MTESTPALKPLLAVQDKNAYNLFSVADNAFLFVAPLTYSGMRTWMQFRTRHAVDAGYSVPDFPFFDRDVQYEAFVNHEGYAQAVALHETLGVRENFVDAEVLMSAETSIPPHDNIMCHDSASILTPVVRRWTVLHAGFDSLENPINLTQMSLHNIASGQRIEVALIPRDTVGIYLRARSQPLPKRPHILIVGNRHAELVSPPGAAQTSWAVAGADIGLEFRNYALPRATLDGVPIGFRHAHSDPGTETVRKHMTFLSKEEDKRLIVLY